jgi:peptidoglycan/xylan/chitin deacetylase (PgdA/CDA1 family)
MEGQDSRLRRRAEAKAARRRRRTTAVAGLGAAVVVAVIAIVVAGGGSGGGDKASKPAKAKASKSEAGAPKVSHAGWKPHPGPVPFLMYHVIGDPKAGAPFPELYVSVDDFKQQVDYLDKHGYQAVTQDQVQDAWDKGATLPPKPIVLTFDDGYLGQFTDAMPILRRHGWAGVLNLKAQGSDLNTGEVKKMMAAGWELASHTIHHLDLTKLSPASLEVEVAGARKALQKQFGVAVDDFCYPAGRYNDTVIAAVRKAGYRGATTTAPGLAASKEPFALKRIRINGVLDIGGFALALSSAGAITAARTGGD